MIRPKGKPQKIAEKVLKAKGVKVPKGSKRNDKIIMKEPYLQH